MMIGALFAAAALGLSFRTSAIDLSGLEFGVELPNSGKEGLALECAINKGKKIIFKKPSSFDPGKPHHAKLTELEGYLLIELEEDK